jgi:hypothetical protein
MSLYVTAFAGTAPFGSLIAGSLASRLGTPGTLMLGGITILIAAAIFAKVVPSLRILIKPVYVEKGIIPEVSKGLQSTTHLQMPPED